MGCKVFRANVGLFYTQDLRPIKIGTPGFSDLHGHTPDGRAFYIETKTLTGKASEQQKVFLDQMRKSGAIAGQARSVEDAIKLITEDKDE